MGIPTRAIRTFEPRNRYAMSYHGMETPRSLRDKYTFILEIGHGTQGHIYLAKRNKDNIQVAIKQLNVESVKTWKAYDLFKREASVLQSLDIPGVAKFYEAIECLDDDPPCSYIVQEYIQGQSLAEMIKAGHRFALNRVYDIILQLLEILNQLQRHDPPIVHRDIKPSNILLKPLVGDDFEVYLIDFGAVANPQIQSGGSTVAGTFGYMAPEQMMGKPEPASDIYSLGAVAVHLISGRSPADMPVKDFHLIFEPDVQNMPPALVAALRRMLAPNVADRLCDISVLSQMFKDFSKSVYQSQTHSEQEELSSQEFAAKLKQVEYYGQEGNIELWQRLSDETPRSYPLTSVFSSKHPNKEHYDFDDSEQFNDFKHKLSEKEFLDSSSADLSYEIRSPLVEIVACLKKCLISSLIVMLIAYFIMAMIHSFTWNSFVFALAISITVGFGIIIFIQFERIYVSFLYSKKNREIAKIPREHFLIDFNANSLPITQNYFNNDDRKMPESLHSWLLENGRKTIATVVNVQYIQVPDYAVETRSLNQMEFTPWQECFYSYHGKPRFMISYQFNPPDDKRAEDIVHSIITYTDAGKHLKPGDPLPILYTTFQEGNDYGDLSELVISTPFPYPLSDPLNETDIIFCDVFRAWGRAHVQRNENGYTRQLLQNLTETIHK